MNRYPTISTRCGTFFTMPRMADVSGRSITWFSRVKPSPLITLLCFRGEQIADRPLRSGSCRSPISLSWLSFQILSSASRLQLETLRPETVLQFLDRLAAQGRDRFPVLQFLERVKGRFDHVMRVGRANRLGQHVLHARRSHHGAHRAAGNHARAFRRRLQQYHSRSHSGQARCAARSSGSG